MIQGPRSTPSGLDIDPVYDGPGTPADAPGTFPFTRGIHPDGYRAMPWMESFASGFSLDLMVKDLGIAASVASDTATPTVLAERCLALWQQAQQALGRGHDHTEMARWIESAI